MATENLEVQLSAEISKLRKGLKEADVLLKKTGTEAQKTAGKLDKNLSKSSKRASSSVNDLGLSVTAMAIGATTAIAAVAFVAKELYKFIEASNTAKISQLALAGAMGKATASTAAEIIKLDTLVELAQDENLSRERRNRAINTLQRTYPKYLKNLSTENINTKKVKENIDLLSNSLVRHAKIKAISAEITRQSVMIYQEEAKSWIDRVEFADLFFTALSKGASPATAITSYLESFNRKANTAGIVIKTLTDELKDLIKVENQSSLLDPETRGPDQRKSSTLSIGPKPISVLSLADAIVPPELVGLIARRLSEIELLWLDTANQINELAASSTASTLSDLGTNIGEALANGGNIIETIGASLLGSLGSFISSMGDLLIKYGILAVAKGKLDTAIAVGGPVAIGAGLAAIGVGIALKAAAGAFGALSQKGLANQGAGGAGLNKYNVGGQGSGSFNGSTSTGGVQTFGDGTVVFEIAGTKLVGVLSRTLAQNKRLGGTLNLGG